MSHIRIGDVSTEISQAEAMGRYIQHIKFSDEDRDKWSVLIKEFNALYHAMGVQTWGMTKWRGIHVLKPPTDLWVYQELIYEIKPDLIIETGSFCGGSALYMRDVLDKSYPEGKIISIDINQEEIRFEANTPGLIFYKGSSVSDETITYVKSHIVAYNCQRVMVILDSEHEESHVLKELALYMPLVTVGSILIVEDTSNHPGPIGAVNKVFPCEGWKRNLMCEKFMLTFCRDGYWEKVGG